MKHIRSAKEKQSDDISSAVNDQNQALNILLQKHQMNRRADDT